MGLPWSVGPISAPFRLISRLLQESKTTLDLDLSASSGLQEPLLRLFRALPSSIGTIRAYFCPLSGAPLGYICLTLDFL